MDCTTDLTPEDEIYHCDKCGKDFKNRRALLSHSKRHKEKKVRCHYPHCNQSFAELYELKKHMGVHTDRRLFPCKYCENKYKYSGARSKHVKKCHPEEYERKKLQKSLRNCTHSIEAMEVDTDESKREECTSITESRDCKQEKPETETYDLESRKDIDISSLITCNQFDGACYETVAIGSDETDPHSLDSRNFIEAQGSATSDSESMTNCESKSLLERTFDLLKFIDEPIFPFQ